MERGGHVVFRKQGVEVQGEYRQHAWQHNGQLYLEEGVQSACPKVARRVLQLLIYGVERRLDHAQCEWQLHHCIGHDDEETHIFAHVEVGIEYIPYLLGVEERAIGVADQNSGQQPREQQAVFQHSGPLLAAILKDVIDRHHHDDARQCRRQGRKHKAQPDAPHGVGIGKQTGNGVWPRFELAAVGHELVILRSKEVDQSEIAQAKRLGADGGVILEGEKDNHYHRRHIDDEQHVGVDVRKHIGHGVGNLLLDQLGLGFAHAEVVPLALIVGQHREQDDGKHGQQNGEQRRSRLGKGFVRHRGARQTHDFRIDGVIAQQRRGAHGAKTRDEGHDRQGKHGGNQRGEHHARQHLEGLRAHVARSLHGVVVNAADGISQKQRVVGRTGKGHGEQHRVKARKPVAVHIGKHVVKPGGQNAVAVIKEQITRHQGDAGVDQRGHVAQAQDLRALDVEVFRQKHNAHAHDVHRHHQAQRQLEGIPHVLGHVARKEKADDSQRVGDTVGVFHGKDLRQRVQARQQHEAKKQIHEKRDTKGFGQQVGLEP